MVKMVENSLCYNSFKYIQAKEIKQMSTKRKTSQAGNIKQLKVPQLK